MSSADGKWDRDVAGDPLPPWGARSGCDNGEFNHDGATDDSKVDHTESGGGEQTTDVGGFNIVIVGYHLGDNVPDNVQDHDGTCDDGEVDRTGSGGGE
jgi:hypothetical protein